MLKSVKNQLYIFSLIFLVNMGEKGQISIFIILGLILIFTVTAMLYLSARDVKNNPNTDQNQKSESQQIQNYIDNCVKKTSLDGLLLIGKRAGYITPPDIIKFQDTSFWFLDQINIQPSVKLIASDHRQS